MLSKIAEQVRMDFADSAVYVYLDAGLRRLPLHGEAAEQQAGSDDGCAYAGD